MTHHCGRRVIPPDYDENPDRFRLARSVLRDHGCVRDVHARVARRLLAERLTPVLDVGCGEEELARHLPDGHWVGLDSSSEMLARAPEPNVLGEATGLPFPDVSFPSLALLYVLYHLREPARALSEARRVLYRGGLVAVAAPSRADSPELAHALPRTPLTFDAELAPDLVGDFFVDVEIERWDAPLLELPTRSAVCDYLVGKGADAGTAEAAAERVEVPLGYEARRARLRAEEASGDGATVCGGRRAVDPPIVAGSSLPKCGRDHSRSNGCTGRSLGFGGIRSRQPQSLQMGRLAFTPRPLREPLFLRAHETR